VKSRALPEPPPLDFAETLRTVLAAAEYSQERVVERMGGAQIGAREHARILRATRACTPLDVLIRLFVIAEPVRENAVRAALAPSALEAWIAAGLLEQSGRRVRARFALIAEVGAWILSDLRAFAMQGDYVVGLGSASILGIRATPRAPVRRALEIGAGSGGAALLLARHAEQVISTDVNPRALAIAAFNARLNGAGNLALRHGSLFEPVAGERFDLIVSNPPFAIGPSRGLIYREGGFPLDGFVERMVRGAPAQLEPGGVAVITANWIEPRGHDWHVRLARWTSGAACDALFVRTTSGTPETYASSWLGETFLASRAARHRAWDGWVSHLEHAGVGSVGAGLIALRRTGRPARAWFLDGVDDVDDSAGAALVGALDELAQLAELDDAALLAKRPRVQRGVEVEQLLRATDDGWSSEGVVLRRRSGLQLALRADARVATVLIRSDGQRSVAEVAREVARELGEAGDAAAQDTPRIVRLLAERGLLTLSPL
jgi:SAM-dependent methyltransferase